MRFGTFSLPGAAVADTPGIITVNSSKWSGRRTRFDEVWLTEHHFIDYGLAVDPATLRGGGASDAGGADRPGRGHPAFHHPVRLPSSWR